MADAYTFLGLSTLGFPDYRDTATGMMLVAEPGESYGIAAVDGAAPVPPADGRWDPPYVPPAPVASPEGVGEPADGEGSPGQQASAPPGPEPPPAVPPVPPVPPLEGGE